MRLKELALIALCAFSFASCENEASEEELNEIRKFTRNAYSDIEPWRVDVDSLDMDYSDMGKAWDVPISKFERVQNMIVELPRVQREEFKRVKVTLDSLKDLDKNYSN